MLEYNGDNYFDKDELQLNVVKYKDENFFKKDANNKSKKIRFNISVIMNDF